MSFISIDASRCLGDGLCVRDCVCHCIRMKDGRAYFRDLAGCACIRCGHCAAICPAGAVSMDGLEAGVLPRVPENTITADDFAGLAKSRRSTRLFEDRPVPRELLRRALDTARYAPTAKNVQGVGWVVLDDRAKIQALAAVTINAMRGMKGFQNECAAFDRGRDVILRHAPCVIFAHAKNETDGLCFSDCAVALTYLEFMLYTLGLGTTWAGYVVETAQKTPAIRDYLGLPEGHNIFAGCMAGYPSVKYLRIPERRPAVVDWI